MSENTVITNFDDPPNGHRINVTFNGILYRSIYLNDAYRVIENGLEIDWIGGNCPVQSEGAIDGEMYYFRARGERWEMYVGKSANTLNPEDGFHYQEPYGTKKFAAGWMSETEALCFIHKAVGLYREWKKANG